MRVTLYTLDDCAHSARLRDALVAAGDAVIEVNLSREPQATTELLKLTDGRRVVPVLVRGGEILVAPEGGTSF